LNNQHNVDEHSQERQNNIENIENEKTPRTNKTNKQHLYISVRTPVSKGAVTLKRMKERMSSV